MLRSCASAGDITLHHEQNAEEESIRKEGDDARIKSNLPPHLLRATPLRSSLRKRDTAKPSSGGKIDDDLRLSIAGGRKTVSFCSRTAENKKVSNVDDMLQVMQNGTELIKLRTNIRQFRRLYTLDADLAYIRWTPTNKKPHKARIAVESIREVRVGWNTENLRATGNSGEIQEECAFSIIHGELYDCLDLIAMTPEEANIWATGLMAIVNGPLGKGNANVMATLRERWLASMFREADIENKGLISEKAAVNQIKAINGWLTTARIKHKIKELCVMAADESIRGKIDCDQFIEAYKDLATRPEVYFLMVRYANKDYLSCRDLRLFLETEQGMSGITESFCENIIEQCEPCCEARDNNCMTVDGFTYYLLSSANSIFDPAHERVLQDMDRPFREYFIATSYNTYLVEDQLRGPSSIDGYISALKRNCRFIELDLWEPEVVGGDAEEAVGQASEPMIHASGTLASKIPLSEALRVIAEMAFERTRYPLFIRLEVHLSIEWQHVLCDLLIQHLSNKLYRPAYDPVDWTAEESLPTPKKFLNKIILVGNRLPSQCDKLSATKKNLSAGDEDGLEGTGMVSEEDEACDPLTGKPKKQRYLEICERLSSLIAPFTVSKQLKVSPELNELKENLDSSIWASDSPRSHVLSMCETTGLRIVHNQFDSFNKFYRNFMLRVTPNLSRVESSNLNPQEFWNFGFNFVALNYQTPGLMMDLQEGKFAANGGCGYLLKPSLMFEEEYAPSERMPATPQVLHMKILSAQQLIRPRGSTAKGDSADPFVVVEVFGLPADCAEERTKTINDEVNPQYDESFQFEITLPELALVRFLVLDDDYIGDDFIGQYTIPFECLQSGYRHVPLLNNEGDPIENSSLFVHIAITNRRGGGKARKRGMSVRRKTDKVQTGMKMIGIKAVDELFKLAAFPLSTFIEMRSHMEAALISWHEECGLGPTATMRQGIRLVHSRVATAASTSSASPRQSQQHEGVVEQSRFAIARNETERPTVKIYGAIPEGLEKALNALEVLMRQCEKIEVELKDLSYRLSDATAKISECNSDLTHLCADAGFGRQKSQRAVENFSWNIRLLKAQLALMSKTQIEANGYLQQVVETGKSLGILET